MTQPVVAAAKPVGKPTIPITDADVAAAILGVGKHVQLRHLRFRDESDIPNEDGQMHTTSVLVHRKGWQMWLTKHELMGPCVAIWNERLAQKNGGVPEPTFVPMNNVASALPR